MTKGKDGMGPETVREIDCDAVMRRLFDYLDGEVEIAAEDEIHHHIEECRSCFTRVEFEKQLKSRVRGAGKDAAPESLRDRIAGLMSEFGIRDGDGRDKD